MIINDYILAKRFIKGDPSMSWVYADMYNIISSSIDLDEINFKLPELVTCYSTERTCEFVSISNKNYIIYDQHLGETFNILNRIFFNSTDTYDIVTYAYKVLAEIYHFSSKTELSQLCLIAYVNNKEDHETYKNEQNLRIRSRYTYFQEFFVLMHEVAHWHLSQNKDKSFFISEKRNQLIDYLLDLQKTDDPGRTNSILSDIAAALNTTNDSLEEYITSDMYKEFSEIFETQQNNLLNKEIELVKSSDDFIEECLCDDIATNFLVQIMNSMYSIAIEECLQIIYLGLENLEILTILRSEALKKQYDDMPEYLMELLVRDGQFRSTAPLLFDNLSLDSINKCNEMFINSNRRFTEIIKDPILFLLTNTLDELRQLEIKYPKKITSEEYNDLIKRL